MAICRNEIGNSDLSRTTMTKKTIIATFLTLLLRATAFPHEWPEGDVCPVLSISNETIFVRFQRIDNGEHLGYYQAELTQDGRLRNEVKVETPKEVWPFQSGPEALPGHWAWYNGYWHTIDPRSRDPATLCILQSNYVKTVQLSVETTVFEPSIDPFVITNDSIIMIGYAETNQDKEAFSTDQRGPASLCVFSVTTGKLKKKALLGLYEYAAMLPTLRRSGFIMHAGKCHLVWVKRNTSPASLTLMLTTINFSPLEVTHRTLRQDLSGNSPISAFVYRNLLLVAFHIQKSRQSPARIEVLRTSFE